MADVNWVFGVYGSAGDAEAAVSALTGAGIDAGTIMVLHPDNQATRDFAQRKGTRLPAGISHNAASELPLDGSWGLLHPGEGPIQGALPTALADMGIPAEWADGTTRDGKLLISVECSLSGGLLVATTVLQSTGASEVGTSVLPEGGNVLAGSPRTSL